MKRWLISGIFIISVFVFVLLCFNSRDRYRYSDLQASPEQLQRIKGSRTETDRDLVSKISFNGCPLFYDELTSGWFYSVPGDGPDPNPTVSFSAVSKDVRLAFSGEVSPGETISLAAYSGTEYREYDLVFTTLPLIRIECDDAAFPPTQKDAEHAVRFTMIDNRPSVLRRTIQSEGRFHIRGMGSASYPKTAFRLNLFMKAGGKEQHEDRTSLLGLRSDGDWLLYPGYNDQEKIRNVFSSNLWLASCGSDNTFGLKNGNEYRYVELFLNRQYWGLYALGYPIDAQQMKIYPNLWGEYDEFLFKQTSWGPKGGYSSAEKDGLDIQFEASLENIDYGYSIMKTYFKYLDEGALSGMAFNDADNAIDIWLFLRLIQADDCIKASRRSINNILYTIKSGTEGNKILYTPWDMDRSWGNIVNLAYHNATKPYSVKPTSNKYEMLLNPVSIMRESGNAINSRVKARYGVLRAGQWSDEVIGEMLDAFEQDIFGSGAYLREMERWPDGSYIDPDLGLSLFREFVFTRFRSMDEFVGEMSVE